jgi:hypothetical protein
VSCTLLRHLIPGNDDGAWFDLPGVAGLIEEGPDVAGLVFIIEVCGDVHAVHLSPPLARSCPSVLGISLRSTERSQQPIELGAISAAESDSEVRALPGGQQLELVLG